MAIADDLQVTPALDRIRRSRERMAATRMPQRPEVLKPPGPSRTVLWRMLAEGKMPSIAFVELMSATHPVSYVRTPRGSLYCLSDPDLIWELFVSQALHTVKGFGLAAGRPILGDGILLSDGAEHRRNRAMVQPAFTRRQIAGYADDMVAAAHQLDDRWRAQVDEGDSLVDLVDDMATLTLDIVGRTLFGLDVAAESDRIGHALTTVLTLFPVLTSPRWELLSRYRSRPRGRLVAAIEEMDAVIADLIAEKRAALAAGAPATDMLSMLITATDPETGEGLSDDGIRDEAVTLVLAGHETTAMMLSWTWLLLFQNPQARDWVTEEWLGLGDDPLGFDDIARLPRTRAVLAESMRLRPPAWAIDRQVTADVVLGEWTIPEGAIVITSQWAMHRDPRFWRDPLAFDPKRWLTAEGKYSEKEPGVPRGAWFPFGFAPRRCIGDQFALTEAALVLATLGRRWHVIPLRPGSIEPHPSVTLRPSTEMPSRLRRRA